MNKFRKINEEITDSAFKNTSQGENSRADLKNFTEYYN